MDFTLFGKTILGVNKKFGRFLGNQLRKRALGWTERPGFSCDPAAIHPIFGAAEPQFPAFVDP